MQVMSEKVKWNKIAIGIIQGVRGPKTFMDYNSTAKQTNKKNNDATFTICILEDILLTLLGGVEGMYAIVH